MYETNMTIRIILFIIAMANLLLYFGVWIMLSKDEDRRVHIYVTFMMIVNIIDCFLIGLLK